MNKTDFTKNPALWMMIGVPLFSVVTSACLIYMAISSFDGLVVDDYYKKGKEINLTIDRDRRAANLGLNADFVIDPDAKRFEISLDGSQSSDSGVANNQTQQSEQIVAKFLHRTLSGRDVEVPLNRQLKDDGYIYVGNYPELSKSRWLVELAGADWRLTGEMVWPAQQSFELEFDPTLVSQ